MKNNPVCQDCFDKETVSTIVKGKVETVPCSCAALLKDNTFPDSVEDAISTVEVGHVS